MFRRATTELPSPPKETKPHPYGVDVELLRRQLKARLYPQLTAAHLEFVARQEKFPWLSRFHLEPPPDFEGGEFRFSFTFTSAKEWQETCAKLSAVDLEDIDELCRRG